MSKYMCMLFAMKETHHHSEKIFPSSPRVGVVRVQWRSITSGSPDMHRSAYFIMIMDADALEPSRHQGPVSISDKTSYRKISWSLEAARFVFRIVRSLWNLTGTSAAMLNDEGKIFFRNDGVFLSLRKACTWATTCALCLSNFKAMRDYTRSCDKTSYRILRRAPWSPETTMLTRIWLYRHMNHSPCTYLASLQRVSKLTKDTFTTGK